MDRLSALSRGMQIMLGAGVLLLIDTFLAWQSIDVGPFEVSQNAWHGFWGIVMGIALIALLAWAVARIAGVELRLPVSETMIATLLAVIVFLFALIKNLVDDYSTIWSYIGVLLAAALAFGAWLELQAAGGVDTLRTEMDSMRSRPTSEPPAGTTSTAAATEPPAPPSSPPPPPAQPGSPPPSSAPSGTTTPGTTTPPGTTPPSSTQPPGEPPPPSSEPTH